MEFLTRLSSMIRFDQKVHIKETSPPRLLLAMTFITAIENKLGLTPSPKYNPHHPSPSPFYTIFFFCCCCCIQSALLIVIQTCSHPVENSQPVKDYTHKQNSLSLERHQFLIASSASRGVITFFLTFKAGLS